MGPATAGCGRTGTPPGMAMPLKRGRALRNALTVLAVAFLTTATITWLARLAG